MDMDIFDFDGSHYRTIHGLSNKQFSEVSEVLSRHGIKHVAQQGVQRTVAECACKTTWSLEDIGKECGECHAVIRHSR